MNRMVVESSSLTSVSYSPDQAILQIEFRDGTIYDFFDVPWTAAQQFLQADSKGGHFNAKIRNVFRCQRVVAAKAGR
jgi:hypothetical protein